MRIEPPLRIDLAPLPLVRAFTSLTRRDERAARNDVEGAWPDGIAFLSVRSGLCALLEACSWPKGSEVLVSALTIGDIPKIIAAYGYVPVAVDVDPDTLAPSPLDLAARWSPKSRALIVAHLFGSRVDLSFAADFCDARNLLLVEDCAQAFVGPAWRGDARADVAMFSFGTLKTQTALGGAVLTVRDASLRTRMSEIQSSWPAQSTAKLAQKLAKTALFLVAQNAFVYGVIAALVGPALGAFLRKATRGFPARDVDELLSLLKRRPCAPLLAFLAHRLASFDGKRLERRAATGELLRASLPSGVVAGGDAKMRTHWIFGVRTRDREELQRALLAAGVDASGASNIGAVGGVRARALVDDLVFVPAYPELGSRSIARIADVIQHQGERELVAAE